MVDGWLAVFALYLSQNQAGGIAVVALADINLDLKQFVGFF